MSFRGRVNILYILYQCRFSDWFLLPDKIFKYVISRAGKKFKSKYWMNQLRYRDGSFNATLAIDLHITQRAQWLEFMVTILNMHNDIQSIIIYSIPIQHYLHIIVHTAHIDNFNTASGVKRTNGQHSGYLHLFKLEVSFNLNSNTGIKTKLYEITCFAWCWRKWWARVNGMRYNECRYVFGNESTLWNH